MASEDLILRAATTTAARSTNAMGITSTHTHAHHPHTGGLCIPLIRVPIPNPLGWLPRPRILGGVGSRASSSRATSSKGRSGGASAPLVASASVATISETVLSGGGPTASQPLAAASALQLAPPPPATSSMLPVGTGTPLPPPSKVPLKPASDVLCGALARAASQSAIHPLDTLKVRLQARARLGAQAPASATAAAQAKPASVVSKIGQLVPPPAAAPSGTRLPTSLRDAALGLASLYRGVFGAASGAGIAIGAYFAFYGAACNVLSTHCTDMAPTVVAFVSGGVAAVGSSVVKVPLAVCIRSVQAGVYPNVAVAARSIVAAAGSRGLFTGFLPTLLEDVPDMAIKFAAYESMRQVHSRFHKGRAASPQEDFAMGAVAGSLAAAATTPLDVIKTNMMCVAAQRPSMLGAARLVAQQGGGLGAFFRGVGPRALSNGINSAVFFAFFEALRGTLATAKRARAEQQHAVVAVALERPPRHLPTPLPLLGAVRELPARALAATPAAAPLAAGSGALVLRRSTSMEARGLATAGALQYPGEGGQQQEEQHEENDELLLSHAHPLVVGSHAAGTTGMAMSVASLAVVASAASAPPARR